LIAAGVKGIGMRSIRRRGEETEADDICEMIHRVVDTNVAIVANGRDTNATVKCQLACLTQLRKILEGGQIVIDDAGDILEEYRRYLSPSGQPGVGDRFFREILINFTSKVQRVHLEKKSDGSYSDFLIDARLKAFDASDRKFAAVARKVAVPVLNATDSDWLDHREALADNGIVVEFACGCQAEFWFTN
jgi:hypothetical protein